MMMTMKQEIPEEVITDILWRLPISHCIARFQCVCKSWRALLSDPSFILRDGKSADSRRLQIMINFIFHSDNDDRSVYSLYSADTLEPLLPSPVPLPDIPGPPPSDYDQWCLRVVGCCNGLICISHGDHELMLWNPATSETKLLPPSPSLRHRAPLRALFGFDPETDDYKIIRQFELHDDSSECSSYSLEVYIYSLRNNSWTKFYDDEDDDGGYMPCLPRHQIPQCNKGKLYWWVLMYLAPKSCFRFYSFDMSNQEFEKVDLPCPFEKESGTQCLLKEESMVALVNLYDIDDVKGYSKHWEIWVLLKYWVAESWTKLAVISSCPPGMHIFGSFGISRNLKCLFLGFPSSKWKKGNYCDTCFVGFHPETGKFSNPNLQIKPPKSPYMINYMPSQICIRDYYMSS